MASQEAMSGGSATVPGRQDPKLWPIYLKLVTLFNVCFFTMNGNMFSAAITAGFPQLAMTYPKDINRLADQVTYSVLLLGLANLFWMPTALCLGKRPVILFSMSIFLVAAIWACVASSFNSLFAARMVAAVSAGSIESLGPSVIGDIFFEKNFSTAMAFFAMALIAGSNLGPLFAGFLISSRGLSWASILPTILIAINLVLSIFLLPETTFNRVRVDGTVTDMGDKQDVHMFENEKGEATVTEPIVMHHSNITTQSSQPTKTTYGSGYWKDLFRFKVAGVEHRGLKFWLYQFTLPLRLLAFPAVLFAMASYGVTLGWAVIVSTLTPAIFAPPPYNFTSSSVGLFALAGFTGIAISLPVAGPMTDWMSNYLGRRSARHHPASVPMNDIDAEQSDRQKVRLHKPEHRIPALIVPFIICPIGLIIFSYSYISPQSYEAFLHGDKHIRVWSNVWIRPAVGYAMLASGIGFVSAVMLSYVVDAYPEAAGEAVVVISCVRNVIAFGISVKGTAWLQRDGVKKMFWTMAASQWAVFSLAVPLYFAGPWLRKVTSKLL